MSKALQIDRALARFAAARLAGMLAPGRGGSYGPLSLVNADPLAVPGAGWTTIRPRLAGICGSDLSTIDATASRYFEPIVSFPFVPGHEVVADADIDGTQRRVVLEPVLGCATRGITPMCPSCTAGNLGNCERIAFGILEPGLQSGFCCDTGGGWSQAMLAHHSQLHVLPDSMSDEDAVLIEPAACAIHAALRGGFSGGETVAVLGAGTLGLLTVAALRTFTPVDRIVVAARYPHQVSLAKTFGADATCPTPELARLIRSMTNSMAIGNQLTGGADAVLDCVGDSASLAQCLAITKPRGQVIVVGMPAKVNLELTTLWHRETSLVGAYAYGTERVANGATRRTFDMAIELAESAKLGQLLSATYPLDEYKDAIEHAATAGRRGAVKIAFDLRSGVH
jgi:threonine dehydrogenase-like Zn-dependent dehydrogenase